VPGASIKHHPDGDALLRSRKRWTRDVVLLTEALKREPTHARSAFYLAMTYLWLGRHDEAIPAFRRRIELGGWREEVYEAKMGLAEATEQSGSPWPEVLALYLDAHAFAPHRAEPLYRIALHYNSRREHALCLLFARRGMDIPLPAHDILFVDADVYRWKLLDLVGSSAYWVGEYALGEEAARKALRHRPNDTRLEQNLAFYVERRQKEKPGRSGRSSK
jgi:tetratricopeptide (TPR) repeat protein